MRALLHLGGPVGDGGRRADDRRVPAHHRRAPRGEPVADADPVRRRAAAARRPGRRSPRTPPARGATVVVGTNGTLLTERAHRGARRTPACHGRRGERRLARRRRYHDHFRHGAGALAAHDRRRSGRLREHRLDFIVQTTVTRGNRHEIPQLVALGGRAGRGLRSTSTSWCPPGAAPTLRTSRPTNTSRCSPSWPRSSSRLPRPHDGARQVRAAVHAARARGGRRTRRVLNYETRCPCGTQYCRITPDGKLTPCPYMPTEAGDLRAQSFGEIWARLAGVRRRCAQRRARRQVRALRVPQVCGGCRARALAASGDFLAEDPSCVYEPTGDRPLIERRSVTYGSAARPGLEWTPEASERMAKIPVVRARRGHAADREVRPRARPRPWSRRS